MNRDNALLEAAEAHARYCEEAGNIVQIAAAVVALVGFVVACFLALHVIAP